MASWGSIWNVAHGLTQAETRRPVRRACDAAEAAPGAGRLAIGLTSLPALGRQSEIGVPRNAPRPKQLKLYFKIWAKTKVTPPCFCKRVRKLLIVQGLFFDLVCKSAARVRKVLKTLGRNFAECCKSVAELRRWRVSALVLVRVTLLWRPMLRFGRLLP